MNEGQVAQGWYQDPYAIHEHRYFSAGLPTKLVRDGLQESYDPPPDGPLPDGELVPAVGSTEEAACDKAQQSALSERMQRRVRLFRPPDQAVKSQRPRPRKPRRTNFWRCPGPGTLRPVDVARELAKFRLWP
jgi:hypothetical protein